MKKQFPIFMFIAMCSILGNSTDEITWPFRKKTSGASVDTTHFILNQTSGYTTPQNMLSPLWLKGRRTSDTVFKVGENVSGQMEYFYDHISTGSKLIFRQNGSVSSYLSPWDFVFFGLGTVLLQDNNNGGLADVNAGYTRLIATWGRPLQLQGTQGGAAYSGIRFEVDYANASRGFHDSAVVLSNITSSLGQYSTFRIGAKGTISADTSQDNEVLFSSVEDSVNVPIAHRLLGSISDANQYSIALTAYGDHLGPLYVEKRTGEFVIKSHSDEPVDFAVGFQFKLRLRR